MFREQANCFVKCAKIGLKNTRLQVTIREMQPKSLHFLIPIFLTCTIAGSVLAILAPLGTGQFSVAGRFGYWIGLCLAGGLGAGLAQYIMGRILNRRDQSLSRWPMAAAQSVGATAFVSLCVFTVHPVPHLTAAALTLFYIWVIAITISAVGALQKGKNNQPQSVEPLPAARPALLERLKPALRDSEIYALEAQDHYVRVITSAGEQLLLMRLSDAISEVSPLPGLSPHRSWWVAQAGIKTVSRGGGKAIIVLHDDSRVPISRGRSKLLRAEGWI